MTNYTSGPWQLDKHGFNVIKIEPGKGMFTIALLQPTAHIRANARLIVKAPELLDMVEAALSYCQDDSRSKRRRNAMIRDAQRLINDITN